MKNNNVQLMVHKAGGLTTSKTAVVSNSRDVVIKNVYKPENNNYLFIDIAILPSAKPGFKDIRIANVSRKESYSIQYELKKRREGNGTKYAQGVRSSDFIYLLMPDRFSNGDESNDRIAGMRDQTLNRDSMYHRHGGDIQGVINHLDYLQELGVTTLWMTPVIENDMPNRTEHGYAFTNHYKIEPRFGGEAAYKKLSDELHKRGMKLIQDAVYNHVGSYHFTVLDMPMKDWLHQWPSFTQTSYKDQPLYDIYGSARDRKITADGWFTRQMPDMNQGNPYCANFMIQHAIWSVEEFGVDGWRIDTYIYNDLDFMNRCNKALLDEYPNITMFGETWVNGVANQAYFTENNYNVPFKSNLIGVTDFQLCLHGINDALTQDFGWTDGVNKLYQNLALDFVYQHPMNHVIFLDNHDMTRFLSTVKNDEEKLKVGLEWLFTCRGIPELYYGTEILMKGVSNPDGYVRGDFIGGWKKDSTNKFTAAGRTKGENEVHDLVAKLANFRNKSSAIKTGKMMQYVPEDGLYVYFRYDDNQTVMCIMNTGKKAKDIDFSKYNECTQGFVTATSVVDGIVLPLSKAATIPPMKMWVMELKK